MLTDVKSEVAPYLGRVFSLHIDDLGHRPIHEVFNQPAALARATEVKSLRSAQLALKVT